MDLTKLPLDVGVLVGKMRVKGAETSDIYYGIGANFKPDGDDKRRDAFVVVTATKETSQHGAGHVIAKWTLYGLNKKGTSFGPLKDKADKVKSGYIVKCDSTHYTDTLYRSSYLSCEGADALALLAHEMGSSFDVTRNVMSCVDVSKTKDSDVLCQKQSDAKLMAAFNARDAKKAGTITLEAVKVRIAALRQDLYRDPYWFSCSLGCCTAM
jgi:hypothetical protein